MSSSIFRNIFSWSLRNRLHHVQDFFRNLRIRWVSGRPMTAAVEGQLLEHRYLRPILSEMAEGSTWCVDEFVLGEDFVEMRGWALVPFDRYSPTTFTLNGREFDEIEYPLDRQDVGNVFWYRIGAAACGFRCRTQLDPSESMETVFPGGFAELQFSDSRAGAPYRADHAFFVAHPDKDDVTDPGPERRFRVHGNALLGSFQMQGASAFVKLEKALNKVCGKSLEDFPRILDWGCGCGRLTRYFRDLPACEIHGTDIDRSNIDWCAEHLDFGNYEACKIDPPTPYPDRHFNLIFGISVMTHLAEEDRFRWLEELDRICEHDGIVLLTVQSKAALCRTVIRSDTMVKLRQSGAIDVDVSLSAEDLSTEPRRYIDCFLMEEYIRHRWADYFEILDVIPGYIGNVQDLVVLRKKAR